METNQPNRSGIVSKITSTIGNGEIAAIAERYLQDERKSDIQTLLNNPETQQMVIDQLKSIADRASRSLIGALIEGPGEINTIPGTQAKVDALSSEMEAAGSRLFIEKRYKTAKDPDYMQDEKNYHRARRENGDARWLAWDGTNIEHRKNAVSILEEATNRQGEVKDFLERALTDANLPEGLIKSKSERVKGVDSLFGKIAKFRNESWGKDATIANAVDLLGARVVVSDLKTLEAVMQSIENTLQNRPEYKVLRKENKFTVNNKTADPYRAIHYIITLPEKDGQLQSFEIQLSTFPALLAGELAHDAIYKPHLLNLPSELQRVVGGYNWESDENEMMKYLHRRTDVVAELSNEQKIEMAITELDYNTFYDLVLCKIDLTKPLTDETKNLLSRFHGKEIEKLKQLQESDESTIVELAQSAHDGYFKKNSRDVYNLTSAQFGSVLSQEAVSYLTPNAQEKYLNRYENFNGANNKLSVEDLELHKLTDEELEQFFIATYKDLSIENTKAKSLFEKIKSLRGTDNESMKERKRIYVMNLNHAPFGALIGLTQEDNPGMIKNPIARELFKKTLIASQLKAIATASLLTEIGGYDGQGKYRDLSQEALPNSGYSIREMLTHSLFITVNRISSETAPLSFQEFAFSEKMAWARDNDKSVDQAILSKLVIQQVKTIESMLTGEENPVLVARYLKSRNELLNKYMRVMVTDHDKLDRITTYIDGRNRREVNTLLIGGQESSQLMERVKDPTYFKAFTNYLFIESQIPNILDS